MVRWSVRRAFACTAVVAVAATLLPAAAAFGHASGIVPQARLSADGHEVSVHWWAAGDDVADIGVGLGLLPEEASLAFIGIGEAYPTPAEEAAFARSDALHAYLLDNLEVSQDGVACEPSLTVPDEVFSEGVHYAFTCPEIVEQVAVHISLLHDVDERFRTYSVDGTVWTEIHSVRHPEHVWDATLAAPGAGGGDRTLLFAGLGILLGGGGAGLWVARSGSGRLRSQP
jgi:hypothetical protein